MVCSVHFSHHSTLQSSQYTLVHYNVNSTLQCTSVQCTARPVHCARPRGSGPWHCTAPYFTALYCTTLHQTAVHSTFIYSTELDCSALLHSAVHHPAVHFTIVRSTAIYCAVLYCIAHYVEGSGVSDTHRVCSPLELEESELELELEEGKRLEGSCSSPSPSACVCPSSDGGTFSWSQSGRKLCELIEKAGSRKAPGRLHGCSSETPVK